MSVSNAISAHGTIIKRNGTPIAELRDITLPPLTRKPIETTMHNSDDDSYVVGIRRKGELSFAIGFLPSGDSTHNAVAGLMKAWADGSQDLYEVDFPDAATWSFSGFVSQIAVKAPVDGGLEATVNIRPSGGQVFTPHA
ncbi:MAG TPA: phage tail tube protein [Vicinamibacterales bacterium]|nr:phage tail tube protein [Vicinamibacterales bacterium]